MASDITIDIFENVVEGSDKQYYRQSEERPRGVKVKRKPFTLLIGKCYVR